MSRMSDRGKRLQNFNTILSDAWLKVLQDSFHKTNNPKGIINLGVSENKLMYDVLKTKNFGIAEISKGVKNVSPTCINYAKEQSFHTKHPSSEFKMETLLQFEESCDIQEHHTHYCDFGGLPEFKRGIADLFDHMMKPAEPVDPDNLLVLNGCSAAVEALSTVLTDPGEGILIPSPFYGGFDADLTVRAQAVPFPVYLSSKPGPGESSAFELTVDQLERTMKDAKKQGVPIRCLLLTNPNNPLGNIYSERQLQNYLDFAHRHSLHVILDEIYTLSIFKKGYSMKSILSFTNIPDRQRLHVVWGFSKDFGISGFRCGVLHTWNKQIMDAFKWVAYFQSVPTSTQCLLMNIVKDIDWIDHVFVPTNHQRLLECHSIVCEGLQKAAIPYVDSCAGLFIWVDLREFVPSGTFGEELSVYHTILEHKVNINPGQSFYYNEPGWFRIVFATNPQQLRLGMERFLSCLEHIREEVAKKKQKHEQTGTDCHNNVPSSIGTDNEACRMESSNLEDLARTLCSQIRNSNWLEINTAEKWTKENPELAKAFTDIIDDENE